MMAMMGSAMAEQKAKDEKRHEIVLLDGRTLIVVGEQALMKNAKGTEIIAMDGEYVASNGKLTYVKAGKVVEK